MELIVLTVSLLFVIVLLVGVTVYVHADSLKREDKSFKRRFPPISDEEFVARCTPGTDPDIALRVRRIVAYHLGVEYERIYPSTRFVDDLGLD